MAYNTLMDNDIVPLDISADMFDITEPIVGMAHKKRHRKSRRASKHSRRYAPKSHKRRHHKSTSRGKTARRGKIHFTKKGQPYRIMPNGRAKFIKRSS